MSLTLSSREHAQLVDALAVISTPLAFADTGEWRAAVSRAIEPLLGADGPADALLIVATPAHRAVAPAMGGCTAERSRRSARRAAKLLALLRPAIRASAAVLAERGAARGGRAHPPPPRALSDAELRRRFGLTTREIEVARLLAVGRSAREVAAVLGLSYYTARHHVEHVLAKLGVHTRAAVASAIEAASHR